ncbi:MAG: hypothetical protein HKN09_12380 [Saprospiraceae bacterium]|nr:hypothetical protein [Saprospiraceae bacterium]
MLEKGKYYLLTISVIVMGCAKFGAPGGGPNDTTPPEILWALSDANYQTNFNKTEIRLEFNEWVTVSNPLKEIVVSPPLTKPFTVNTKGKAVIFEFPEDEILKEDVTYQINYGNAIKDFSAGNILKNQVFVFSTGDIIDSLEIGGTVFDELSGKPVKDATVVVYDDLGDSVLYNQKPFYFAKSDKDGKFLIKNMRSDTFQIFGLLDNNVSYTYDLPGEQVAFFDRLIYTSDTMNNALELFLFDEEEALRLVDYRHDKSGIYKIKYDRAPINYSLSLSEDSVKYFTEILRDTLFLYHDASRQDSFDIIIELEDRTDTLKYKKARKGPNTSSISYFDPRMKMIQFHADDTVKIEMNIPLRGIDTSLISLRDTSGNKVKMEAFSNVRQLEIIAEVKSNNNYELTVHPGALSGLYGQINSDTLDLTLKTHDASKFGRIGITLDSLDNGLYIAQLLNKNNLVREMSIDTSYLEFTKMKAGSYQLKIIEDSNGDGRWSPGSFYDRRRSERQGVLTLEDLKEGWDLELTVNLKTLLDGA